MSLEEYHKKRNFSGTPEPAGEENTREATLRFVVQRHAASHLHYDFRLEMDGVLKSWAIPKGPSLNPEDKRLAVMAEDHPFAYRNFQGEIPPGNYGAGEVEIWDEGTYRPAERMEGESDDLEMQSELQDGALKFVLNGKRMKGEFALVKLKHAREENAWLLIKHKDQYAVSEPYNAEEHTDKNSIVTAYLEMQNAKKKSVDPKNNFIPK